jgi:hypothetical protein
MLKVSRLLLPPQSAFRADEWFSWLVGLSIKRCVPGLPSHSSSAYLFKEDLQSLSNRIGLKIRIAHYPPYCSKYNPIEHRVFPHVTRACQGVPLDSVATTEHYMPKTTTTKGLKVFVRIIEKVFSTGRKVAEDFKETMKIQFDAVLPKFNYTAIPQPK